VRYLRLDKALQLPSVGLQRKVHMAMWLSEPDRGWHSLNPSWVAFPCEVALGPPLAR